jgi:hypothetical protein
MVTGGPRFPSAEKNRGETSSRDCLPSRKSFLQKLESRQARSSRDAEPAIHGQIER